ncbi:hypothetical protein R5W24_000064 [Gemmata sp. JC717]|uniref:hypothetical protein n=1 Tax=Gemmata algarum TaxID=2975278 RepID=UPI0021BB1476|nr:hypothetical protein [Gemmata algarum]MDY3550992.1 hypothetical protein [Gemmata algarum]
MIRYVASDGPAYATFHPSVPECGVLHLTVYDRSGKPFGGLYFGTSSQMKAIGDWSLDYYLIGESPKTP